MLVHVHRSATTFKQPTGEVDDIDQGYSAAFQWKTPGSWYSDRRAAFRLSVSLWVWKQQAPKSVNAFILREFKICLSLKSWFSVCLVSLFSQNASHSSLIVIVLNPVPTSNFWCLLNKMQISPLIIKSVLLERIFLMHCHSSCPAATLYDLESVFATACFNARHMWFSFWLIPCATCKTLPYNLPMQLKTSDLITSYKYWAKVSGTFAGTTGSISILSFPHYHSLGGNNVNNAEQTKIIQSETTSSSSLHKYE